MHVLVTRPEEDSGGLKAELEARGHQVSLAPLMKIEYLPIALGSLQTAAAIVATSRNGLRALSGSDAYGVAQTLPLFVVGSASARLAQDLAFRNVIVGPGTAAGLAPIIADYAKTHSGCIVLITGDETAFDMEAYLTSSGTPVQSIVAYRANPAQSLPDPVLRDLERGSLSAVILMSARTAKTWMSLSATPALRPGLAKITHMCLSESVGRALKNGAEGVSFSLKIETASRPEIEGILALIDRLAAQSTA